MSRYPYEIPEMRSLLRPSQMIEQRALKIAHSEGRTEVTQLDRLRAERELQSPDSSS